MKTDKAQGLKVKAGLKAGGFYRNHSRRAAAIRVKTGVTAGAGIFCKNHNRVPQIFLR